MIIAKNDLNSTAVMDDLKHNGHHVYSVRANDTGEVLSTIYFQNGGRGKCGAVDGVTNEDLMEILIHRFSYNVDVINKKKFINSMNLIIDNLSKEL